MPPVAGGQRGTVGRQVSSGLEIIALVRSDASLGRAAKVKGRLRGAADGSRVFRGPGESTGLFDPVLVLFCVLLTASTPSAQAGAHQRNREMKTFRTNRRVSPPAPSTIAALAKYFF